VKTQKPRPNENATQRKFGTANLPTIDRLAAGRHYTDLQVNVGLMQGAKKLWRDELFSVG